jgi:hypothetical protein
LVVLKSKRTKEGAIALSTGGRSSQPGQDILLDDDPASIVDLGEVGDDAPKINRSSSKLTKDALTHRLEVIPSILAYVLGNSGLAIFEMDVPDTFGILPERGMCITTPIREVSGIETKTK